MLKMWLQIITIICAFYKSHAVVPVTNSMKSFTNVIKAGSMPANKELTVYENDNGPGLITEQWFTGFVFDENSTLRIYVDDEITSNKPGIECLLYKCHSIGYSREDEKQYAPWSTNRIGHNAYGGGLFNTYQIPFGSKIKITLQCINAGTFYYMTRGVLNYPLIINNLQFPANTRLKLYKNANVTLQPLDMLTLANVSNTAGYLYQIFMAAESTNYNWIEGCYRVKIDDDTVNGHSYQFLSSGVEDFYLSGYAFDLGVFHGDNSGCTYRQYTTDYNMSMSAYKFFENDPILFTNSLNLLWKAGTNGDCPNTWPPNKGSDQDQLRKQKGTIKAADAQNIFVTSYAWVYEYTFS